MTILSLLVVAWYFEVPRGSALHTLRQEILTLRSRRSLPNRLLSFACPDHRLRHSCTYKANAAAVYLLRIKTRYRQHHGNKDVASSIKSIIHDY